MRTKINLYIIEFAFFGLITSLLTKIVVIEWYIYLIGLIVSLLVLLVRNIRRAKIEYKYFI